MSSFNLEPNPTYGNAWYNPNLQTPDSLQALNQYNSTLPTPSMYAGGSSYLAGNVPPKNTIPQDNKVGQAGGNPPPTSPSWNTAQNWIGGINALAGIGDLYLGHKNYKLQKDAFKFNKEQANRDYLQQSRAMQNALEYRAASVAAGMPEDQRQSYYDNALKGRSFLTEPEGTRGRLV